MKNKLLIFFAISLIIVSGFCVSLFYKNKNTQTITIYNTIDGTATIEKVSNTKDYQSNIKPKEMEGYNFDGFYVDNNLTTRADFNKPAGLNTVLYAAYIQNIDEGAQINTNAIGIDYSGEISSQKFAELVNFKKVKLQTASSIDFSDSNNIVEELEIIGAQTIRNINNFSALKNAKIQNVQEVDNSFNNCNKLTSVNIDCALISNSFCNSGSISNINLGQNLTEIDSCFYRTNITNMQSQSAAYLLSDDVLYENISNSKKAIKALANISSFVAPANVTEIKDYAFYGCANLKTASLNSSIEFVGEHAFEKSSIEAVNMQNNYSPLTIKKYAFAETKKLNMFKFSRWTRNIEDYAFYKSGISGADLSDCDILTNIKQYAFAYCNNLLSAKFMENLSSAINIYKGAFAGCQNLQSVQNIFVVGIDEQMFYDCKNLQTLTGEQITQNIGDLAFYNCQKLANISILSSAQNIGRSVFEKCNSLSNIVLQNVQTVSSKAFANIKNLQSINLGNNVQQIDFSAFDGCENLTNMLIASSSYLIQNDAIYSSSMQNLVYYLSNSQNQSFNIPSSVLNIDAKYLSQAKNLKTITSQSSRYIVQNGALFSVADGKTLVCYPMAREAEEFVCPSDTQTIDSGAFINCPNLKSISFSSSAMQVKNAAMQNLLSIEELNVAFLGETISNLNTNFLGWFFGAKNYTENNQFVPQTLKNVTISEQSNFAAGVLYNCEKITTVTIENIKNVSDHMFSGMLGLQTLILGDAVKSFGKYALYDCRNLRQLDIKYYQNIVIDRTSFSSVTRVVTVNLSGITDYASQFIAYREKFNKSNWNWKIL